MASESGGWLNRVHVIPGRGCVCGVVGCVCPGSADPGGSEKSLVLVEMVWNGLS